MQSSKSVGGALFAKLSWMLMLSALLWDFTKEIGSLTELKPNKIENFLIEETALKEAKFSFRLPQMSQNDQAYYLVVNFNQFRVFHSNPDIPVIKVLGEANNREYTYYSTESPDWTFDEPLLVIPLLNFDNFNIQIEWRDHGFHTTFKGMIGVFTGTALKTVMGFNLPVVIAPEKAYAQVVLEYPPASEVVLETLVQVKLCQGTVSSIILSDSSGKRVGELVKSQSNPHIYHMMLQNVHAASSFELKLVASPTETKNAVVARVQFLPLVTSEPGTQGGSRNLFLKELLDYKHPAQLSPLGSGSTAITWTNLAVKAKESGYSFKTLFNFGVNKADVEFKARCGFCKLLFTRKFPSVEGVESATFLPVDSSDGRTPSYELAYYAEPKPEQPQFSFDLWVERTYRFTDSNRQIMMGTHYVVMKEIYFSENNYRDGTFLMATVNSEVLAPAVVSNTKLEGYSRFHGFAVRIALTFFGGLAGLLCILNLRYRRKKIPFFDNHIMVSETDGHQTEASSLQAGETSTPTPSSQVQPKTEDFEQPVEDADDEGDNEDPEI